MPSWIMVCLWQVKLPPPPPPPLTHTNIHSNYSTYWDQFHGVWNYLLTSDIFYKAHVSRILLFYPNVHQADEYLLQFHVRLINGPWSNSHHCGFRWWCVTCNHAQKKPCNMHTRYIAFWLLLSIMNDLNTLFDPLCQVDFATRTYMAYRPGLTF